MIRIRCKAYITYSAYTCQVSSCTPPYRIIDMPIQKMDAVVIESDLIDSFMTLEKDNSPILGVYILVKREVSKRIADGVEGDGVLPTVKEISELCNIPEYSAVSALAAFCLLGLIDIDAYNRLVPDHPFEDEAVEYTDTLEDILSCL